MEHLIDLELDIHNACRINIERAFNKDNNHYDLSLLANISGANFEMLIKDLQWCAKHNADHIAIETVKNFAEAILSAYEIQSKTYK